MKMNDATFNSMVEEYNGLMRKLNRLTLFKSKETFELLHGEERYLLDMQYAAMKDYALALGARCERQMEMGAKVVSPTDKPKRKNRKDGTGSVWFDKSKNRWKAGYRGTSRNYKTRQEAEEGVKWLVKCLRGATRGLINEV